MKIGGFIKTSLIDYAGKIAAVIFLCGCNFRCPYCHNPELVKDDLEIFFSEDEILDFLKKRKNFLEGVVISGGEPFFQKELKDFILKIKSEGYFIKIDTNGSFPERIKEVIELKLIDYIAMDIKKDIYSYYPLICSDKNISEKILQSIEMITNGSVDYEFRTTCVKDVVDKEDIEKISKIVANAKLYVLQNVKRNKILSPEFFKNKTFEYSEKEIFGFKEIADNYVKKCIIRR